MTKEVTTKKEGQMTTYQDAWGAENTDTSDILIPKVLLMQGLSQYVTAEKAQMGDLVDSVTGEVLGTGREKALKPVKIIPLLHFKNWTHNVKGEDGKWQYKGTEAWGPTNANLPRYEEYEKDGQTWKSDATLNFYCLVLNGNEVQELPYLVSFRRTSYRAGQKLVTHFTKCQLAAKAGKPVPPAATTFELGAKKVQNDQGTFYVFDLGASSPTNGDWMELAYTWYQTLKAGTHKIDTTDEIAPDVVDGGESTEF